MTDTTFCNNVSSDDFGVMYGFSIFEAFLVNKQGQIFLLDRHIDRLLSSLRYFQFEIKLNKEALQAMIIDYVEDHNLKNIKLRFTVTFGNKSRSVEPSILFAISENPYSEETYKNGVSLSVSSIMKNADSPIIRHKSGNYLENYLEGQKARENGFDDALFLNTRNEITETTRSNIFFVTDGIIKTPDISCGLLPGIIRGFIIENSKDLGLKCEQGQYSLESLLCADEIFVTNSVFGVLPVKSVNNKQVQSIFPGKITSVVAATIGRQMIFLA